MVHLKPRSELFKKFSGLVYDGGEIGECQYYSLQGREFYGRCSKLTISTLSESYVWGKKSWRKRKED